MAVTIHVNGTSNSLVHRGSDGFAKSTLPNVCKTPAPGGPVPVPYPSIVSLSRDLQKGTMTVRVDGGNSAAVKGSEFSRCTGDEPGTAGGVKSGTNMKEATWLLYSFDVKLEGRNACRLSDKMMMNHGNSACLSGEVQEPVGPPHWDLDCVLERFCRTPEGRQALQQLATRKVKVAGRIVREDVEWDGSQWQPAPVYPHGWSDKGEDTITVSSLIDCDTAARTLFHENIHLAQSDTLSRADAEIEALTKMEEWAAKTGIPGNFSTSVGGQSVPDAQKIADHAASGPVTPDGVIISPMPNGTYTLARMIGSSWDIAPNQPAEVGDTALGSMRALFSDQELDPADFKCP